MMNPGEHRNFTKAAWSRGIGDEVREAWKGWQSRKRQASRADRKTLKGNRKMKPKRGVITQVVSVGEEENPRRQNPRGQRPLSGD